MYYIFRDNKHALSCSPEKGNTIYLLKQKPIDKKTRNYVIT